MGVMLFGMHSIRSDIRDEPDEAIRAVVTRLSRPHASGGAVIERAAILAEGADADGDRRVGPRPRR